MADSPEPERELGADAASAALSKAFTATLRGGRRGGKSAAAQAGPHQDARLLELARQAAGLRHFRWKPGTKLFEASGHDAYFPTCRHADCALVRTAVLSASRTEPDEEMVPHAFNSRTRYEPGDDRDIWCKDCEYHRDHAIHAASRTAS